MDYLVLAGVMLLAVFGLFDIFRNWLNLANSFDSDDEWLNRQV